MIQRLIQGAQDIDQPRLETTINDCLPHRPEDGAEGRNTNIHLKSPMMDIRLTPSKRDLFTRCPHLCLDKYKFTKTEVINVLPVFLLNCLQK